MGEGLEGPYDDFKGITISGQQDLITEQTYIYQGNNVKNCIFGYSGPPGWPINNQTEPILLPMYPLT